MNDWLKDYQKTWKSVHVENIDERLQILWQSIEDDQKKNRRTTIWMSLAFVAATGVILWVAISNDFSSLTPWATMIGVIVLMMLTSYLRVKSFILTPDPLKSNIEHIDKIIDSYSLRLKLQQEYLWFYLVVLNMLLIVYYFDSFYPDELSVLMWAVAGTIGHSLLIVLLMNKKRRKDIKFVKGLIEELKAMKRDLKE